MSWKFKDQCHAIDVLYMYNINIGLTLSNILKFLIVLDFL